MVLDTDDNMIDQKSAFLPGQVCKYFGPISSLIIEENERNQSEKVFGEEAVLKVSMRDFLASLLRMINIRNDYFIEQFDCKNERRDIMLDLLSPGTAEQQSDSRGGILHNFNLQNISTQLAKDPHLCGGEAEEGSQDTSIINQEPLMRQQISDQVIRCLNK